MKPIEKITCQFTCPDHWDPRDKGYIDTLRRAVDQERVKASDLLKAAMWLATEALRHRETPSFRRGFLAGRLKKVGSLAAKHNLLTQCWPGLNSPPLHLVREQEKALDMVTLLEEHSPRDVNTFDTSGDIW